MTDPSRLGDIFADLDFHNNQDRFPCRGVIQEHDGTTAQITVPSFDGGEEEFPVTYLSSPPLSPGTLVLVCRDEVDSYWVLGVDGGQVGVGSGQTSSAGETGYPAAGGKAQVIRTIKAIAVSHSVPPEMAIATCYVETNLGIDMHTAGSSYWGWYQMSIAPSEPYSNAGLTDQPTKTQAEDLGYSCDLFCRAAAARVAANPSLNASPYLNWAMTTQGVTSGNNPRYPQTWNNYFAQAKLDIAKYAP